MDESNEAVEDAKVKGFPCSVERPPVRKLNIGNDRFTTVQTVGDPGCGGANHVYEVVSTCHHPDQPQALYAHVHFQNGPIKEAGVIDRLQSFQAGEFNCRENALAITKLEEALHWLNHRTASRQARGVEGRNIK